MKWKKAFKKIGKSVTKVAKGVVKANVDFAKGGLTAAMDVAHGDFKGAIKDTAGQFAKSIKDVGGGIPGVSSVVDLASGLVSNNAGLIADVGEMALGVPPVDGLGSLGSLGSDLGQLSNLAQVSPDSLLSGLAQSQDKNGLSGTGQAKEDKVVGKKSSIAPKAKGIIEEILEMIFGSSSTEATTTAPNHSKGGVKKH